MQAWVFCERYKVPEHFETVQLQVFFHHVLEILWGQVFLPMFVRFWPQSFSLLLLQPRSSVVLTSFAFCCWLPVSGDAAENNKHHQQTNNFKVSQSREGRVPAGHTGSDFSSIMMTVRMTILFFTHIIISKRNSDDNMRYVTVRWWNNNN